MESSSMYLAVLACCGVVVLAQRQDCPNERNFPATTVSGREIFCEETPVGEDCEYSSAYYVCYNPWVSDTIKLANCWDCDMTTLCNEMLAANGEYPQGGHGYSSNSNYQGYIDYLPERPGNPWVVRDTPTSDHVNKFYCTYNAIKE